MSTKEQLMQELDTLTETQLKALLLFIHSFQTEYSERRNSSSFKRSFRNEATS